MTAPADISVVIPCFNAERYIEASVRSVLAQRGAGVEVIVVDDGSRDRSADIVAERFPEVTLLRQANRGVAAARNAGIAQARGEWVAFLDADDLWLPGKLQAQRERLAEEPSAQMCYCAWQVWTSDAPEPAPGEVEALVPSPDDRARWAGPDGWIYPELLLDCEVWTSTTIARRSLLERLGGFDEGLRIGEDYDLWLRASRETPILRVARPLALYRQHPQSITRRAPDANHRGLVVSRAVARWGYASPDGRRADKRAVRRALARSWSDFGGARLDAGDTREALHSGWQSLRSDCRHVSGWKVLVKGMARSLPFAGAAR